MRYKNESIEMGEIVSERDNIDEKTKPQCASVLSHYDTYLYLYEGPHILSRWLWGTYLMI